MASISEDPDLLLRQYSWFTPLTDQEISRLFMVKIYKTNIADEDKVEEWKFMESWRETERQFKPRRAPVRKRNDKQVEERVAAMTKFYADPRNEKRERSYFGT